METRENKINDEKSSQKVLTTKDDFIDVRKPRYNQQTYIGRFKHFYYLTNPFNLLATNEQLEKARYIIDAYKKRKVNLETLDKDSLWKSKYLVDSAYHPCSKEKMFILGRMSAQVPCSLIITAGMLTWYKASRGTIFWQWINQTFNAIVNYTNRSEDKPISKKRICLSYLIATTSATATALYLNSIVKKFHPLIRRLVPFTTVALTNCLNIPFMRSNELQNGIQLYNENDEKVGSSTKAARVAISQVVVSRTCMRIAPMIVPPLVLYFAEKRCLFLRKNRLFYFMSQSLLIGFCLFLSTPLCCAIYPQKNQIQIKNLDHEAKVKLTRNGYQINDFVYFNKGL